MCEAAYDLGGHAAGGDWVAMADSKVKDLSPLANLKGIIGLDLWRCKELQDIGPLGNLRGLQTLNLSACDGVDDAAVDALRKKLPGCKVQR
jgi:hypothetical protein